jgi:hypothetical protein
MTLNDIQITVNTTIGTMQISLSLPLACEASRRQ